jgi:hypothetical protein
MQRRSGALEGFATAAALALAVTSGCTDTSEPIDSGLDDVGRFIAAIDGATLALCTCGVEQNQVPSLEECLASFGLEVDGDCLRDVIETYPEVEATVACGVAAAEGLEACTAEAQCDMSGSELFACFDGFYSELDSCPDPPPEAGAAFSACLSNLGPTSF